MISEESVVVSEECAVVSEESVVVSEESAVGQVEWQRKEEGGQCMQETGARGIVASKESGLERKEQICDACARQGWVEEESWGLLGADDGLNLVMWSRIPHLVWS